ncbi:transmembrane protein 17A-like isoform X2 [Amblyraja radiata]|uniref:transmembrane protein 17A-like isoform X2 n=1 Tax=Amblyraja radiata TaxID=386614 RepID=UPI001402E102|nr:transmembrane protein 17A-like isoform X2 [Amblyraja radiata]
MEGNPGRECYPGQTVVSSLALQMFLYFNCYFFPFWWACHIVMLELKYFYLSTYYRITLTALIVVMTLVEVARLYLGYLGNLQEKVPALAGSWLLSLLLQAPMLLFHLCNPHLIVLPVEWATGLLYLAFIATEIVLSIRALRRLTAQLEERFHLAHLHLHQERQEGPNA